MAETYLHRALDPNADKYVYWYSDLPYDGAGSDYTGPPDFSTLENVTMIQVFVIPDTGARLKINDVHDNTLVDTEEVS